MLFSRSDPFQALFELQSALESNLRSDWHRGSTVGTGTFPPINIFQKGDDFAAVIKFPRIDKSARQHRKPRDKLMQSHFFLQCTGHRSGVADVLVKMAAKSRFTFSASRWRGTSEKI